MGNFWARPSQNNESNNNSATSGPTLNIGNHMEGCVIQEEIVNKGEISVTADDRANLNIGHRFKTTSAKKVVNVGKQTLHSVQQRADVIDSLNSQSDKCTVCYERPKNWIVRPCDHAKFCKECIETIMNGNRKCPYCRKEIHSHGRIYLWITNNATTAQKVSQLQAETTSSNSSSTHQNALSENESNYRPIGNVTFSRQPGEPVTFNNVGPCISVKQVNGRVNTNTTYSGDGKEKDNCSYHLNSNNGKIVNNVGPAIALDEAGSIINELNVSIGPSVGKK